MHDDETNLQRFRHRPSSADHRRRPPRVHCACPCSQMQRPRLLQPPAGEIMRGVVESVSAASRHGGGVRVAQRKRSARRAWSGVEASVHARTWTAPHGTNPSHIPRTPFSPTMPCTTFAYESSGFVCFTTFVNSSKWPHMPSKTSVQPAPTSNFLNAPPECCDGGGDIAKRSPGARIDPCGTSESSKRALMLNDQWLTVRIRGAGERMPLAIPNGIRNGLFP